MWLKLSKAGAEGVRMLWGNDDGPYDPYQIGPATLKAACDAVREALATLVRVSASTEAGMRARALRELASAGNDLYCELFDSKDGSQAALAKTAMAENYARGDTKLRITGHPDIHVPWALVFEREIADIPDEAENLDAFRGFWGLKFGLSATLSGYNQPRAKLLRQGHKAKLLSLMNYAEASRAHSELSDELKAAYSALLARPVGVAHDFESCRTLIEQAASYDTILHVFAHQSDGKLDLGSEQPITIIKFKRMLERLTEQSGDLPSYSLVMLSACESAMGDMDYSFTAATDRTGMCGSIGTESVVPRDFAARFAIRFLSLLLGQGKSIGESMEQLRNEPSLWPLSLVYGCYAQPDYRIGLEN